MCSRDGVEGLGLGLGLKMKGLFTSEAYQRAKLCAETLHFYLPEKFPQPEAHGMFDVDWDEYVTCQRRAVGGPWWALDRPVAVFMDDRFIGSDRQMLELLLSHCVFYTPPDRVPYDVTAYLHPTRCYCYLDIAIGGEHAGSLTFELFDDVVPNTCQNFLTLCTEQEGYRGSQIHRVAIPSFIQGGMLQSREVPVFPDENYAVAHDKRGILSMANDGVHTNGSQFFVTLAPTPWMDRTYVAFGRLVEGAATLAAIEQVTTYYEMPTKRIEITACGRKYAPPVEIEEESLVEEEETPETLVRSLLDDIIDKMGATEVELPDERDAESVLAMKKYKRGEYSAGVTEDMLSDVEPLDEDLPESLKIVWLLLRDLVGDKTMIRAFARRLVNEIVEAVFKEMRIKDAFSGLMAAFSEWPDQIDALLALVRKVLGNTKRMIDVLDLGPGMVIVRELLDEVLDAAMAIIQVHEEMALDLLEDFIDKTVIMVCVRNVITDMVSQAMDQAKPPPSIREGYGEGEDEGEGEEAPKPAEEKPKSVEAAKPGEEMPKSVEAAKPDEEMLKSVEAAKPDEEMPKSVEAAKPDEEMPKSVEAAKPDEEMPKSVEEKAAPAEEAKPAEEATEEKTEEA